MRRLLLGFVLIWICLVQVPAASAQRAPGGNSNVWHTGVGLLGYIRVRDELKLTDDQMAGIKTIGDEFLEKYARPFEESARGLSIDEQKKKFAALKEFEQEAAEKAEATLTTEQGARLKQIKIWLRGPAAFTDADIARELDLTDEQKGTLKSIGDEYQNEVVAITRSLQPDFRVRPTKEDRANRADQMAKATTKREELRAAKESECLAVLTDAQKAQFLKLRGPKFELGRGPSRAP